MEVVPDLAVVDLHGVRASWKSPPVQLDSIRVQETDLGIGPNMADKNGESGRRRRLRRNRHGADERADERGKRQTDEVSPH